MTSVAPAGVSTTGERIGSGGEADIFAVPGRPSVAMKRYRRPLPGRTEKLQLMVAHPPELARGSHRPVIAWPTELITEAGEVTGFLMPRVGAGSVPIFRVYNPQSRAQLAPAITWRYLVRVARNVAAIVASVHDAGYVIGDLNESNLLVDPRGLVALVDCDSMQVTDTATGEVHRCNVGRPEFTSPECQGVDFSTTDRTRSSDSFALTILVFQLLMQGVHPYAGIWRGRGDPPDVPTRIKRHRSPYRQQALRRRLRRRIGRGLVPPPMAPPASLLPAPVRRLVKRGLGRAGRRPSAREWLAALESLESSLRPCRRSAHHVSGRRTCPWCGLIDRGFPDPFPGPEGSPAVGPRPPRLPVRAWRVLRRTVTAARARTAADRVPPWVRHGAARGQLAAVAIGAAAAAALMPALAVVALSGLVAWAVVGTPPGRHGADRRPLPTKLRAAGLLAAAIAGGLAGGAGGLAYGGWLSVEASVVTVVSGVATVGAAVEGRRFEGQSLARLWAGALGLAVAWLLVPATWWPLPLGR